MFVVLSRFIVGNEMTLDVKKAFHNRPHLVDKEPGFIKLDVISPQENLDEIWLISYWEDEASYRMWRKSHKFRESHKFIPKGLKLLPKSAKLNFFEQIMHCFY